MKSLLTALGLVVALVLTPLSVLAQERPNTILVLDASGSMWGQIDGINKIVIAREVVADLLADFPADQNLGLVTYGHNRRGDCSDIETLVAPAAGTADQIIELVNGLNPRGMTPMTDAVVAAAEALRHTENAATVILVSDGIETCNPDPCAAARVLEETGVDFTAHVVGFDVSSEPEALAQMQCIADETGGTFIAAENAAELSAALASVMAEAAATPAPVPAVMPARVGLTAVLGSADGPVVDDPVTWTLAADGTLFFDDIDTNPLELELQPMGYRFTATNSVDGSSATLDLQVESDQSLDLILVLPAPLPAASVEGPATAPLGSTVAVAWTGPDNDNDFIGVRLPGERYTNYTYTRRGNPAELLMPTRPGGYEIAYYTDNQPIAVTTITLTPIEVSLTAPETAAAGATVEVAWTGPDYDNDFIGVGLPGEDYTNYTYTRRGNPLGLEMPTEPGDYEIRYYLAQGQEIVATRPITLGDLTVSLTAPETAAAGATVEVAWTGPDYDNDFIGVGLPGEDYTNYTYTRRGNPLGLEMPTEPGDYEIRYYLAQGQEIVATRPITLGDLTVSLTAPETAAAGATVEVAWTGPDYDNDFIGVGLPGEDYTNYTYTRRGNPLGLEMPTEPGDYEIRYYLGQGQEIVATRPITLGDLTVSLTAPETAAAGATVEVAWTGPDYDNDFIGVGLPGEDYTNYTYTRRGNPLGLEMPTEPGDYEIRYYLGQGQEIVATRPITLGDLTVSLTAPETAAAGATVEVAWTGPDYDNDFIGVGLPGEDYTNYTYTRRGNPLGLEMPTEPGDYEIRYYLGQGQEIVATRPITLGAVTVKLTAPDEAEAGSTLQVLWSGPGYDNDFIGIGLPGEEYASYAYTRRGNPLEVEVPALAGDYEVRYYLGQGQQVIATAPLRVTAATASMTVTGSPVPGAEVQVAWVGPGNRGDFIGIGLPGERYETHAYVRNGNPLTLPLPEAAGAYELRYYLGVDETVIASQPLTVGK